MSKLLAMMMKPKNYMYATIKGSLTESPTGVFSGFSSSNYLELQNSFKLNANTVAEFKFKVNLTGVSAVSGILSTPNNYGMQFICANDSKLTLYLGNNSSWTILSAQKGTTILQVDTDYYIRIVINKGNITLLLSTDNINWTTEFSVNVTISEEYTYNLVYGRGRTTAQYLRGSIYLNQSYIKINNTKYQLQAVVGYTVFGSPTIVAGVVSGFSASNYLKIQNIGEKISIANNWEFVTKIHTSPTHIGQVIIGDNASYGTNVRLNSENKLVFQASNDTSSANIGEIYGNTVLSDNTNYYIKVEFTGTKYKLYYSNDNTTWILEGSFTNSTKIANRNTDWLYGMYSVSAWYFRGSIDMNETYIKSDGKLWFNGQSAS